MKKFIIAGVGAVALFGGGALVGANAPSEEIYACVNNSSGEIKIVDADATCKTNETLLEWNKQGPAGVDGVDGKDGVDGQNGIDGVDGQDGLNGVSGYRVIQSGLITVSNPVNPGEGVESVTPACDANEVAVGGGVADQTFPITVANSRDINIAALHPANPSQWRVRVFNGTASPVNFTVYTVCVATPS